MLIINNDNYMNAGQFSKNILDLNEHILFVGIVEKSGHLSISNERTSLDQYLKGRNLEMIYSQSVYVTDLRKTLSNSFGSLRYVSYVYEKLQLLLFPIKDHVLLLFVDKTIELRDIVKEVRTYFNSLTDLDLYLM
ncbi:MAG TPA: hypothetical protein VIY08_04645 [Candidatus Nitrosocosmicus sp.]